MKCENRQIDGSGRSSVKDTFKDIPNEISKKKKTKHVTNTIIFLICGLIVNNFIYHELIVIYLNYDT